MAGNAYIMTGYNTEADPTNTGMDYVWTANGWASVGSFSGGVSAMVQEAQGFLDSVFSVSQMRVMQGDFQQKYPDRDVRMERATVTITYPAT